MIKRPRPGEPLAVDIEAFQRKGEIALNNNMSQFEQESAAGKNQ